MNGYYLLVIEQLKLAGYRYSHPGKGSYEIWVLGNRTQTVPRNMPSRHTANVIMKQAGISHRF
jgi:hypothetical protein